MACWLVNTSACQLVNLSADYILQQTKETLAFFFRLFLSLIERIVQRRHVNLSTHQLIGSFRVEPSQAELAQVKPTQVKLGRARACPVRVKRSRALT
jgi:hypothetical protein